MATQQEPLSNPTLFFAEPTKPRATSIDYRAVLVARLDSLRGTGRADLEALHVPTGHADPMDRVTAETERAAAHGRLDLLDKRGRALEKAIARYDAGLYFECEDCEGPISAARLRVVPEASRCIRCQELQEAGRDD